LGLCGDAIPLEARIVGVVDAFDAIVSCRPYKTAVPVEAALEIIRKDRGRHFDPEAADAFLDSREAIETILAESAAMADMKLDEFSWCELVG
jgi:HD-GYP domain-containing protein (c-di-GMP phosphodiesterase class II)